MESASAEVDALRYVSNWWLNDSTQKVSRHYNMVHTPSDMYMGNKNCYQAVILCIAVDHRILESNLITFNGFAISQLYSARSVVMPAVTKGCGMACIMNALKANKKC